MMADKKESEKALEESVLKFVNEMLEGIKTTTIHSLSCCQSPIEKLFYSAYLLSNAEYDISFYCNAKTISLIPQKQIGRYRVDFELTLDEPFENCSKYVIECDGHDFHEKTKEQVERDNKRERFLTSLGYTVVHYSGREIFNDPLGVVEDLILLISSKLSR